MEKEMEIIEKSFEHYNQGFRVYWKPNDIHILVGKNIPSHYL